MGLINMMRETPKPEDPTQERLQQFIKDDQGMLQNRGKLQFKPIYKPEIL